MSFRGTVPAFIQHLDNIHLYIHYTPQSTEVFYLDDGEPKIGPIEKVYVTTLVTPMGLFNYVDGINLEITPKKLANLKTTVFLDTTHLTCCM